MTALLIIAALTVTGSLATAVVIAVVFSRTLQEIASGHSRDRARWAQHMDTLLDRLMIVRWEDYVSVRATEDGGEGGFFPPEAESTEPDLEGGVEVRDYFGRLRHLEESPTADEMAAELVDEDFTTEGAPRR